MSYPAALQRLLPEFHLTSGQVLTAFTFSSSAWWELKLYCPPPLGSSSSSSVCFVRLPTSASPPLLSLRLLVCVEGWCQVEEWSQLMGRWGREGNKAVSCVHFHPPLPLLRNAYKKKERYDSPVSPAKRPLSTLIKGSSPLSNFYIAQQCKTCFEDVLALKCFILK